MSPISTVPTPSTLARKSGKTFTNISLETSVKKLARLVAQTLRGSERKLEREAGFSLPAESLALEPELAESESPGPAGEHGPRPPPPQVTPRTPAA